MKYSLKALFTGLALTVATSAFAVNHDDLPAKKQTDLKMYVTAAEAGKLISKNAKKTLFVDVRTRSEINFLGMPTTVDANIPYMTPDAWDTWNAKKKNFKLAPNSDFLTAIADRLAEKKLTKNDTIVLICRSGSRSSKAANLLAKAGYKKVFTIIDGFEGDKAKQGKQKGQRVVNGWKNSDQPWSYKLDKNKMYFEL